MRFLSFNVLLDDIKWNANLFSTMFLLFHSVFFLPWNHIKIELATYFNENCNHNNKQKQIIDLKCCDISGNERNSALEFILFISFLINSIACLSFEATNSLVQQTHLYWDLAFIHSFIHTHFHSGWFSKCVWWQCYLFSSRSRIQFGFFSFRFNIIIHVLYSVQIPFIRFISFYLLNSFVLDAVSCCVVR